MTDRWKKILSQAQDDRKGDSESSCSLMFIPASRDHLAASPLAQNDISDIVFVLLFSKHCGQMFLQAVLVFFNLWILHHIMTGKTGKRGKTHKLLRLM